jgi:catechol 2,3-dioxygenase-like lactoylglutathione lyase family enzyme
MTLRWYTVVIDCLDTVAQARWWAAALGWEVVHETVDEAVVAAPGAQEGTGKPEMPALVFVPVPERKTVKNRLHLDLAPFAADDQAAEVERLVELGATRVDVGQGDRRWVVLADPEGNEFCVLTARD